MSLQACWRVLSHIEMSLKKTDMITLVNRCYGAENVRVLSPSVLPRFVKIVVASWNFAWFD
jgi:hypothetical protein